MCPEEHKIRKNCSPQKEEDLGVFVLAFGGKNVYVKKKKKLEIIEIKSV